MEDNPNNEPQNNSDAKEENIEEDPLAVTDFTEHHSKPEKDVSSVETRLEVDDNSENKPGNTRASSKSDDGEYSQHSSTADSDDGESTSLEETRPRSNRYWSPVSRNTHHNETTADLEGELGRPMGRRDGSTRLEARYEHSKKGYEELSKNLQDATTRTVLRLCALLKSYGETKPKAASSNVSAASFEAQVIDLEKNLKKIQRHIDESRRDQANLLSQINDLEVVMFKWHETEFLRDFLHKIPTEEDLKKIEFVKSVMIERKRLEKEIQKLNMEMKTMNKTLANADVIVSDSGAIKKPRRVVIRTQSTDLTESSDLVLHIGRGQSEEKSRPEEPHRSDSANDSTAPEREDSERKNGLRKGDTENNPQ